MFLDYKTAKKKLLTLDLEGCQSFFEKKNYNLECAYCALLNDDIKKARAIFTPIIDEDVRAHWGNVMLGFIDGTVAEYPSYFEIRNFLEIDLNLLIMYYKGDYVEKIVSYADFMFTINPEVHKFVGRVFLNNDMKPHALFFLERAKDYFYNDPELHFILASYYFMENDIEKATSSLNACLKVLPGYYPAIEMMKKLQ